MSTDAQGSSSSPSRLSAIKSTADALIQPGQSELAKWKKTFDKFAGEEVDGKK